MYLLLVVTSGNYLMDTISLIELFMQCDVLLVIEFGCRLLLLSCRRILIFPKGNNVDHLSMYLDVSDSSTLPYGWSRYAQFSLAVVNQIHSKYSIRKGIFLTVIIAVVALLMFILLLLVINCYSH